MCQNLEKNQFSILNLLCQIKKRRTLFDCFFCEDYEYLTYFCFAKTGKKLSLFKVCLFFASSICAKTESVSRVN